MSDRAYHFLAWATMIASLCLAHRATPDTKKGTTK